MENSAFDQGHTDHDVQILPGNRGGWWFDHQSVRGVGKSF